MKYSNLPFNEKNTTDSTENYFIKVESVENTIDCDIYLEYVNCEKNKILYVSELLDENILMRFHKGTYPLLDFSIARKNSNNSFLIFVYNKYELDCISFYRYNEEGKAIIHGVLNNELSILEYNQITYNENKLCRIDTFWGNNVFITDTNTY